MKDQTIVRFRSLINRSTNEVFDWHLRNRMVERCIPPSEKIQFLETKGRPNQLGSNLSVKVKLAPFFWAYQLLEYSKYIAGESFEVEQKKGICNWYSLRVSLTPQENHTTEIIELFRFQLPLPHFFSPLINYCFKKRVQRVLAYKHDLIDQDIGMINKYPFEKPLRILVSGSQGLIGKNLSYLLEFMGHEVWGLTRKKGDRDREIKWNPKTGECPQKELEHFDAIIHLGGENIGQGRWSHRKKKKILESRTEGTRYLVEAVQSLSHPPKLFLSASAIGFYGDRGTESLDEDSGPRGRLFMTDVCEQWERASRDLEALGVRTVWSRFGIVLTPEGGALKKMMIPFKWGLGGKLGKGGQYMSWVAIDDAVGALYHILMTPSLYGAVNVVSPQPVTNDIFSKKLAKVLKRWLGPPVPQFLIRWIMGQKGEELLLTSARVHPKALLESGYTFRYPNLCQALEHML